VCVCVFIYLFIYIGKERSGTLSVDGLNGMFIIHYVPFSIRNKQEEAITKSE